MTPVVHKQYSTFQLVKWWFVRCSLPLFLLVHSIRLILDPPVIRYVSSLRNYEVVTMKLILPVIIVVIIAAFISLEWFYNEKFLDDPEGETNLENKIVGTAIILFFYFSAFSFIYGWITTGF